jgi:uncharacterized protein YjeT (DUF2065 family)
LGTALLAIGLLLCVEGLILALAPNRVEDVLEALRQMSPDLRRAIGLGALALGVALVWAAKSLGA